MTGWMLTEQADLFGLEMDALTPEQAATLLEEADREAPGADSALTGDDDRDAEESVALQEPSQAADRADMDDDLGVLFEGAGGSAAVLLADDRAEREPGVVPTAGHDEFVCAGCFLIWHRRLLADASRRLCRDCSEDMMAVSRRSAVHPGAASAGPRTAAAGSLSCAPVEPSSTHGSG